MTVPDPGHSGRLALLRGVAGATAVAALAVNTRTLSAIRVRDPFILADTHSSTYYLYVQSANRLGEATGERGVEAYASTDLDHWIGPTTVFSVPANSWARHQVWAPEVHEYLGKYYLFVTLAGSEVIGQVPGLPPMHRRGTQVLVADSPLGPFQPFQNRPHTPEDWLALDGTLWVENQTPYMVFCHEWVQIRDGAIKAMPLTQDLSEAAGQPITLFHATGAPWVTQFLHRRKYRGYVTDGPFLHRTQTGALTMMWSSFSANGYTVGLATSASNTIHGPWRQLPEPLFHCNGGHSMAFRTFDNRLMLLLHQPNTGPLERAGLCELDDSSDVLRLKDRG